MTEDNFVYKLGKLPAQPEKVKIVLGDYLKDVPPPPKNFGHDNMIQQWGMYGNDQVGDCFWAGSGHEHMLLTALGGTPAVFTDDNIIDAYRSTGFDPNAVPAGTYNPTDNGTVAAAGMLYRRTTGITDSAGNVHKIEGYAKLLGDVDEVAQAAWLFNVVGLGIQFPAFAMDQFNSGKPWDLNRANRGIAGGHYVPIVGRHHGHFVVITWGRPQLVTPRFLAKYMDEAYVVFDTEMLVRGKSIDGFDQQSLVNDLNSFAA